VWDPCGCCRVCSRLEFEPCGGPDGFHGTCAAGLECVADHADLLGTCRREYSFLFVLLLGRPSESRCLREYFNNRLCLKVTQECISTLLFDKESLFN